MQLNLQNQNLYIVSAFKSANTVKDNATAHYNFLHALNNQLVRYSEIEGRYEGKSEKSVILFDTHKMAAHHYATVNGQECFLKLEPHRDNIYKAFFVDTTTGDEVFGGYFRSMGYETIQTLGLDYSKDANGTYFTIWPTDTVDMLGIGYEISEELIKRMEKLG